MTNFRKQQMGHRGGSSSFNRKPPLPMDISTMQSTLPPWEKKFFHSVCSISWKKFLENQKYTHTNDKVMKWEDSAVKEAFDSAKMRFWAKLNDVPCSLPLPDPDIYIDKVDWDAIVDPKLFQDLEKEELPSEEERGSGVVIFGDSLLSNPAYSGGGWGGYGWGDDGEKEEATKPAEAAQGWESNLQENIETNSWEQQYVPFEYPKGNIETNSWEQQYVPFEYPKGNIETNSWEQQYVPFEYQNNERNSWEEHYAPFEYAKAYYEGEHGQNDFQGWSGREKYGGGNNRRRENMTWSRNSGGYYGNEYQMNRGRRNNRGGGGGGGGRGRGRGRRGNFGYAPATSAAGAW